MLDPEHLIVHVLQMDYINTSHPNFLGGSKAVEIALQQVKSSRVSLPISRQKVNVTTSYHFFLDKEMISFRRTLL